MQYKKCGGCKVTKECSEFYKAKRTKDGLQDRCKICNSEYKKNKNYREGRVAYTIGLREQRANFVNEIKSKGCSICGYSKCLKALTFHHKDESQKLNTVANLVSSSASIEVISAEIEKCILVCQNCHHEIHDAKGDYGVNNKHK